jgi:hypothetical protein
MSFVPSVRDCLHRLDRMRDTAEVIAAVDQLNRELWADEPTSELTAASRRLAELHQLALHMAANLNTGAGVPPTPSNAPKRGPSSSAPAKVRPLGKPAATGPQPDDTYTSQQAAIAMGITMTNFYSLRSDKAIPPPDIEGRGRIPAYWKCAIIDSLAAQRNGTHGASS